MVFIVKFLLPVFFNTYKTLLLYYNSSEDDHNDRKISINKRVTNVFLIASKMFSENISILNRLSPSYYAPERFII